MIFNQVRKVKTKHYECEVPQIYGEGDEAGKIANLAFYRKEPGIFGIIRVSAIDSNNTITWDQLLINFSQTNPDAIVESIDNRKIICFTTEHNYNESDPHYFAYKIKTEQTIEELIAGRILMDNYYLIINHIIFVITYRYFKLLKNHELYNVETNEIKNIIKSLEVYPK